MTRGLFHAGVLGRVHACTRRNNSSTVVQYQARPTPVIGLLEPRTYPRLGPSHRQDERAAHGEASPALGVCVLAVNRTSVPVCSVGREQRSACVYSVLVAVRCLMFECMVPSISDLTGSIARPANACPVTSPSLLSICEGASYLHAYLPGDDPARRPNLPSPLRNTYPKDTRRSGVFILAFATC